MDRRQFLMALGGTGTVATVARARGDQDTTVPGGLLTQGRTGPDLHHELYVSPNGNDAYNGLSWATAKQTIQAALNAVIGASGSNYGGVINLGAGTFNVTRPITIGSVAGIVVRGVAPRGVTTINANVGSGNPLFLCKDTVTEDVHFEDLVLHLGGTSTGIRVDCGKLPGPVRLTLRRVFFTDGARALDFRSNIIMVRCEGVIFQHHLDAAVMVSNAYGKTQFDMVKFRDCEFYIPGRPTGAAFINIPTGPGSSSGRLVFDHCLFEGPWPTGNGSYALILLGDPQEVRIAGCEFADFDATGTKGNPLIATTTTGGPQYLTIISSAMLNDNGPVIQTKSRISNATFISSDLEGIAATGAFQAKGNTIVSGTVLNGKITPDPAAYIATSSGNWFLQGTETDTRTIPLAYYQLSGATQNPLQIFDSSGNLKFAVTPGGRVARLAVARTTMAYGTMVSVNAASGNEFDVTVTNAAAFTIANPTNGVDGQRITITVRNTCGRAMGAIIWGSKYRLAAWTNPATAHSRSIDFRYDGTNWVEIARTPNDVPN